MFKNIFIILMLVFITGCTTVKTVYIDKPIMIAIPEEYKQPCVVNTKPINLDLYLPLSKTRKEIERFKYESSLITDISNCNINRNGLRKWEQQTKETLNKVK